MQWSKLREQVKGRFADSVKGRVRLHSTRYRRMHDQEGRAWITVDGREIINMPNIFEWFHERRKRAEELGVHNPYVCDEEKDAHIWAEAEKQLHDESLFPQVELGWAMHEYLSLSMDQILASENILVQCLGMLDRRLGKRRLAAMDAGGMHPLVRLLYPVRCDAEGITGPTLPGG